MTFGFDPASFRLNRIPTPTWASTARTVGEALPDAVLEAVTAQLAEVDLSTEQVFQWAMTDPVATAKFQDDHTYANGVTGDYFLGRRHFDVDDEHPGKVLAETECCLTRLDYQELPAIYQRYLVTLSCDLQARTGQLVLAGETDRYPQMATLRLTLIDTSSVSDIPEQHRLNEEGRALLDARWKDFLTCVQQAAQEVIDTESSSGMFDDNFFPSRLTMTGNYAIEGVSSLESGRINVDLRFTERQMMASRGESDYLGYELAVSCSNNDQLSYELFGSRSI